MNEKEILKIVSACLKGKKESYNLIFKHFQTKLFNFCFHYTGTIQDAEDATVEVFIKAYNSLHSFDGKYKFSTWIYKIAYNHSIEILRKKQREQKYINSGSITGIDLIEKHTPSALLFESNKKERFKKNLKEIPKHFQEVLMLKYYHELSYRQIGSILNIPKNTVGLLILRGKQALKGKLKNEDYYE